MIYRLTGVVVLLAASCLPSLAQARSHHKNGEEAHHREHTTQHVHVKRSTAARHEFQREQACPSTGSHKGACKGYVVDHVKPLACGGADNKRNMQWQTTKDGKAKDKWERKGC